MSDDSQAAGRVGRRKPFRPGRRNTRARAGKPPPNWTSLRRGDGRASRDALAFLARAITCREPRAAFQGVMLKVPRRARADGYAIVLAALYGHEDVVLAHDLARGRGGGALARIGRLPRPAAAGLPREWRDGIPAPAARRGRRSGAGPARRRRRLVANRRPRFLLRRKAGRVVTAKGLRNLGLIALEPFLRTREESSPPRGQRTGSIPPANSNGTA